MIGINTAFQMLTSRRPSAPDGGAGAVARRAPTGDAMRLGTDRSYL